MTSLQRKILLALVILALASPVGIYLPEKFKAGDAWGEWSLETVKELVGFEPAGMKKNAELWQAPIPDYNLGDEKSSFTVQALSYILSGIIGITLCTGLLYLLARFVFQKKE